MLTATGNWASNNGLQAIPYMPGGGALGPGNTLGGFFPNTNFTGQGNANPQPFAGPNPSGPNPSWGQPLGGFFPNTNFTGQGNANPQPAGQNPSWGQPFGGFPSSPSGGFPNTNFTGQGNPNPQQSPEWPQIINWLMGRYLGIGGGGSPQGSGGLSSLTSLFGGGGSIYSK